MNTHQDLGKYYFKIMFIFIFQRKSSVPLIELLALKFMLFMMSPFLQLPNVPTLIYCYKLHRTYTNQ